MNDTSANSLGLLVLGIAVLVATRLAAGRRLNAQHDPAHFVLSLAGWSMITLAVLALLELLLGLVLGLSFWVAMMIVLGMAVSRRRAAARSVLLWVLAVAAEKGMPLAPAIVSFADEWGGWFGQRVRVLAALLEAGLPLSDALARQRRLLSDAGVVAARIGSQTGRLGQALREAAVASSFQEPQWQGIAGRLFYLCAAVDVGLGVVVFLYLQIFPKFEVIYADFGVALPAMTQVAVGLGSVAERLALVLTPLAVLIGVGLPLLVALYYLGWIGWRVPIVARLGRRLETALVLRSLALVTEGQQPLLAGIGALSEVYPRRWVRRKLAQAWRDVEAGADWRQSLQERGLIGASDAAVLRAAERVGNLPWAMRELADGHERRLAGRLQVVLNVAFVLVVLTLALLGSFIVLSVFLPLFKLVNALT